MIQQSHNFLPINQSSQAGIDLIQKGMCDPWWTTQKWRLDTQNRKFSPTNKQTLPVSHKLCIMINAFTLHDKHTLHLVHIMIRED